MASVIGRVGAPPRFAARYGGEEFVVLLPSTEMQHAIMLAEKTRKRIEALGTDGTLDMMITVTIGVAAFPGEAASEEDLLRLVDQRLYAGKTAGRNRVIAGI